MFNIKRLLVLLAIFISIAGCNDKNTLFSTTDNSTLNSGSTESSSSALAKTTSELTADASDEVSDDNQCSSEEPDFAAIKEKLVEKLTNLLVKLNAVDTSDFSEEKLAKHQELIEKVAADLEIVNAATELSDELKKIARKVWNPHRHGGVGHNGPPRKPEDGVCRKKIEGDIKDKHCADLAKVLALEGLSDEFKAMIQARYDESCQDSE